MERFKKIAHVINHFRVGEGMGARGGLINLKDMYNNDVGKESLTDIVIVHIYTTEEEDTCMYLRLLLAEGTSGEMDAFARGSAACVTIVHRGHATAGACAGICIRQPQATQET